MKNPDAHSLDHHSSANKFELSRSPSHQTACYVSTRDDNSHVNKFDFSRFHSHQTACHGSARDDNSDDDSRVNKFELSRSQSHPTACHVPTPRDNSRPLDDNSSTRFSICPSSIDLIPNSG